MNIRIISNELIFSPGIPDFKSCHASTLCLLPEGSIAAAWFGGDHEQAPNVGIWFSKRARGDGKYSANCPGQSLPGACAEDAGEYAWRYPVKIADGCGEPCWNPVLFLADCGDGGDIPAVASPAGAEQKLLLFYKVGREIPQWRTYVKESYDYGESWSEARELVPGDAGGRGPVRNKCIRLRDGAILAPASVEGEEWNCFADRSEDEGQTWQKGSFVPLDRSSLAWKGIIQPTLWEDDGGTVHMLTRSGESAVMASHSADGGRTWSRAQKTGLPNNNSGIDLARLSDGRLVLACNPVAGNWARRSPIALLVSEDNGRSWSEPFLLEHLACEKNEERAEFSYPAIVSRGNRVYLTYTWKRKSIAFWELELS